MKSIENEEGIKDLLTEIKSLRFASLSEEEFWKVFLYDIAKLNKSPFSLLFCSNDNQWSLKTSYGLEKFSENEDSLIQLGVNISSRALKNGFAYEKIRERWVKSNSMMGVSIKIDAQNESLILFLMFEYENSIAFNNSLLRLNIFSDIYLSFSKKGTTTELSRSEQNIEDPFSQVVELTSLLIYQKKFLLASMILVNELSSRFKCSKVSIGWKKSNYIETIAISHIESFVRNSEVVDKLEAVYEECFDQDSEILYPQVDDKFVITHAHKEYIEDNKVQELLSLPLRVDDNVVGVILFEKLDEEFTENELVTLRLIMNQVTPIVNALYINDRNFFSALKYKMRERLSWFLGVNDTFIKFIALVISFTLIYISTVSMEYKIESIGALKTDNISFISAPFDSTVLNVDVRSGDIVKKDDLLLTLNTKELYLKYSEALADVSRYTIEEQKSRGFNELADMQIARAKINQANATKERMEYYLEQAKIVSSQNGVIIEGDHEELFGKPVSKGDMLFKIAELSDLYLTLKVNEEYINEIYIGQKGTFVFLGKTAEKIEFTIDKIIPIANADVSQNNIFIVKAVFQDESKDWWRPGMSGMAKIHAGERKIIWVFTHKIIDAIRLFFWI